MTTSHESLGDMVASLNKEAAARKNARQAQISRSLELGRLVLHDAKIIGPQLAKSSKTQRLAVLGTELKPHIYTDDDVRQPRLFGNKYGSLNKREFAELQRLKITEYNRLEQSAFSLWHIVSVGRGNSGGEPVDRVYYYRHIYLDSLGDVFAEDDTSPSYEYSGYRTTTVAGQQDDPIHLVEQMESADIANHGETIRRNMAKLVCDYGFNI
jgi:hypothetical protein